MNKDMRLVSGISTTINDENETVTVSYEGFSRTFTFVETMGVETYNKRQESFTAVVVASTEAAFMFRDSFLEVAEAMKKRC